MCTTKPCKTMTEEEKHQKQLEYQREHWRKNKEKYYARVREKYRTDSEYRQKVLAWGKKWCDEHPDYQKNYYQSHKDKYHRNENGTTTTESDKSQHQEPCRVCYGG